MLNRLSAYFWPAFAALVPLALCGAQAQDPLVAKARSHFEPVTRPAKPEASPQKVELGRMLFHEPRLSASGAISCNSCHNLATYGSDNLSTSLGHNAQRGGRNAPTVLNAGFHIAQFWDGRAKDLTEQAKGPILNPIEMALPSEEGAVDRIKSIPGYAPVFRKAFPGQAEPITYSNIASAIAAFEETLVTPSRFDRFLAGDAGALRGRARNGLKLFMDKGCASCHRGPGIGGGMYQKFGLAKPYSNLADEGRFAITKKPEDKHVFKVPSLRNITRTYPYFHDGSVWDLGEAVKIMGRTQLGIDLSNQEAGDLVAFLDTLTGRLTPRILTLPVLPPSGPGTVKPVK